MQRGHSIAHDLKPEIVVQMRRFLGPQDFAQAKSSSKPFTGAHLSAGSLVLLCLQEIQQHLQESWVFPIGFHHITSAGHQLTQGPKSHLEKIYQNRKLIVSVRTNC